MKKWVENLFNDLKDVIELEVALHLMIRKREIDSLDIYPSITEFFDYLIFDAEIAIQDKETLHRHYKTANIHNILRVKLKPKDNWEEEKILNPSSLQTIFAIKLKDKNLTNGFLIEKLDIEKLNTTYKRINAKNEQLIEKINKNSKQMKLENKLIPYNDLLDLYKYFMDEIENWVNEAILEEEVTQCVLEDENRIPYLDSIHENRYSKDSLFSYYNLLRSELRLRWLKGRDFNDQDRNSFNRAIKDKPLNLIGYN